MMLPEWMDELSRVQHLWLSDNQLTVLPDNLGRLTDLRTLFLDNNQLAVLPDGLSRLGHLHALHLENNHFVTLPDWLGKANLTSLKLGGNPLATLPEWFSNFTHLRSLKLNDCLMLTSIAAIFQADFLDISGGKQLSSLADGTVVRRCIELADTALRELPRSLQGVPLSWHDVRVNQQIAFYPETLTVQDIAGEQDTERRFIMLERISNPAVEVIVLDKDQEQFFKRTLIRIDDPSRSELFVGLSEDGTSFATRYTLRVPPDMNSCQQASAWLGSLDAPMDYHPEEG